MVEKAERCGPEVGKVYDQGAQDRQMPSHEADAEQIAARFERVPDKIHLQEVHHACLLASSKDPGRDAPAGPPSIWLIEML